MFVFAVSRHVTRSSTHRPLSTNACLPRILSVCVCVCACLCVSHPNTAGVPCAAAGGTAASMPWAVLGVTVRMDPCCTGSHVVCKPLACLLTLVLAHFAGDPSWDPTKAFQLLQQTLSQQAGFQPEVPTWDEFRAVPRQPQSKPPGQTNLAPTIVAAIWFAISAIHTPPLNASCMDEVLKCLLFLLYSRPCAPCLPSCPCLPACPYPVPLLPALFAMSSMRPSTFCPSPIPARVSPWGFLVRSHLERGILLATPLSAPHPLVLCTLPVGPHRIPWVVCSFPGVHLACGVLNYFGGTLVTGTDRLKRGGQQNQRLC